jgi:hypothetical protein
VLVNKLKGRSEPLAQKLVRKWRQTISQQQPEPGPRSWQASGDVRVC